MHAIEALLPYLAFLKQAEAYILLDLRRLKAEGKKGVTEWVHRNRWRDAVKMRKRCYTPDQNAAFERLHRAVKALHAGSPTARRDGPPNLCAPRSSRSERANHHDHEKVNSIAAQSDTVETE